jgi:hypothetical protein
MCTSAQKKRNRYHQNMKALAKKTIEPGQTVEKKLFPRVKTKASIIIDRASQSPEEIMDWPIPIRYAMDILTVKQRHFAFCVAAGKSSGEAYRTAYDIADDANQNSVFGSAHELRHNPKVSDLIRLLLDWLSKEWLLDANQVIEYGYTKLYEEAENAKNASDRLRATEILMKAHGAFISRSEVKHVHEVSAPVTELMTAFMDLIGTAVPISPAPRQIATVDSIEFSSLEDKPE